jgi:hypothetical protein
MFTKENGAREMNKETIRRIEAIAYDGRTEPNTRAAANRKLYELSERYPHLISMHPDPDGAYESWRDAQLDKEIEAKWAEEERAEIKRAAEYAEFVDEGNWETSARGNPYTNFSDYNVVIYPKRNGGGFGWRICSRDSDTPIWSKQLFRSIDDAKTDAWGALQGLRG